MGQSRKCMIGKWSEILLVIMAVYSNTPVLQIRNKYCTIISYRVESHLCRCDQLFTPNGSLLKFRHGLFFSLTSTRSSILPALDSQFIVQLEIFVAGSSESELRMPSRGKHVLCAGPGPFHHGDGHCRRTLSSRSFLLPHK